MIILALKILKKNEDRDFYSLGRGRILAYHDPIEDPFDFAFDVIDIITQKHRAVRLWDGAVIGIGTAGANGGVQVSLINYSPRPGRDVTVHTYGHFTKASLQRPDGPTMPLKTSKRGPLTEFEVPDLKFLAVVTLS